MSLLDEEVAVITGGSSGIGRAIAHSFAEHGADVVVADVRKEPRDGGMPTADSITSETDADATFVECDVTSPADVKAAVAAAKEFGGITSLVNSAGVVSDVEFLEVTEAEYARVFDINVKGTFFAAQAAAKQLVKRERGTIINISSTSGLTGSPSSSVYSASKGAVRLLTYSLAAHLGPSGIRVNAIHPGTTKTPMVTEDLDTIRKFNNEDDLDRYLETVPSRRVGEPSDVAGAAVFLASDLASYVNAESLVVDGGRTHTH